MNLKQLIAMWCGIAFFVYVGLTTETSHCKGTIDSLVAWTDYGPLVARWLSTIVITSGLIYTLRDKQSKKDKDD